MPNPAPEWLSENAWDSVCELNKIPGNGPLKDLQWYALRRWQKTLALTSSIDMCVARVRIFGVVLVSRVELYKNTRMMLRLDQY